MTFPMPPMPSGSPGESLLRQYTYLFELARQLNLADGELERKLSNAGDSRHKLSKGVESGRSVSNDVERERLAAQYHALKALVIKTADTVEAELSRLEATLTGSYVARSDFGAYVEQLSLYLEANPEAVTQYYGFAADLQAAVGKVDADFQSWRTETGGYIRTGIVDYEDGVPVYGVAVGQDLTVTEVDGETVIDRRNFRSTFTAKRLSFWQDETEVAYVSNNRLHIRELEVLDSMTLGPWRFSTESGLALLWQG